MRRAGIGVILPNDLDEAVKEIEFIAKAGLRGGVLLPLIPPDASWLKPLYDPAWERVYAAIQDHGLVMNHHTGPAYRTMATAWWARRVDSEVTLYAQAGYRHLLISGVFEKYPKPQVHPHRVRLRLGRAATEAARPHPPERQQGGGRRDQVRPRAHGR